MTRLAVLPPLAVTLAGFVTAFALVAHRAAALAPPPADAGPITDAGALTPIDLCAADASNDFDRGGSSGLPHLEVQSCKRPGEPMGAGHLSVTFGGDGGVIAVVVDKPFAGTETGRCVAAQARRWRVCPFFGPPQRAGKSFLIN